MGPKGCPKHKIAYCEGKWDFKVPKMHSWVVKLVEPNYGKKYASD